MKEKSGWFLVIYISKKKLIKRSTQCTIWLQKDSSLRCSTENPMELQKSNGVTNNFLGKSLVISDNQTFFSYFSKITDYILKTKIEKKNWKKELEISLT